MEIFGERNCPNYKKGLLVRLAQVPIFHRLILLHASPRIPGECSFVCGSSRSARAGDSTIEVYLSGLRYFNLLANPSEASPSLYSPFLKLLLRGIQRANVLNKPALVRLPVTMGVLAKIETSLAVNALEYDSILTWAAACKAFSASSALVSS